MPQSLYQKYRPQTWAEITDQRHIKVTLENEIVREQIAHAYLFVGPRGVGKTTTARLFAKSVNCENRKKGSPEPCNVCASCQRVSAGQSLDIVEMDAASHTGVDNIREHVLESVQVTAGHGRFRVFIIDEVHMLSTAAFNAMLKVLEEPPTHVIFILATTEIHKVPATIISRCQRFDFKRIPADDIRDRLRMMCTKEGVQVDEEVLISIAERADGSLRDAESTLGQVLSLNEEKITTEEASLVLPQSSSKTVASLIDYCLAGKAEESLALINTFMEEGGSASALMGDCIVWLRTLLVLKVSSRLDVFSSAAVGERREIMLRQAEATTINKLTQILDIFLARRKMFADTPIPQMPLELAVIESIPEAKPQEIVMPSPAPAPVSTPPAPSTHSVEEDVAPEPIPALAPEKPVKAKEKKLEAKQKLSAEDISEADMNTHWPAVLEAVKKVNHSLSFVLANAKPRALRDGRLELEVGYEFHREKLSEPKNNILLNEAASGVLGRQVLVAAYLPAGDTATA